MNCLTATVQLMYSDVFYSAEHAALSQLGQPSCKPVIEIDGGLDVMDEPKDPGQCCSHCKKLKYKSDFYI